MENAVGVALMVVLVFIVVAIFDGATVQRTWTALSATFLSFSFIFGNSIRQACCLNLRQILLLGFETLGPSHCRHHQSFRSRCVWRVSHICTMIKEQLVGRAL